jgi:hypothetical protein
VKDRRFTIVEKAGYVGETEITSFPSLRQAMDYMDRKYTPEERDPFDPECLHVDIRQDWTDEETGEEMGEYVY